MYHNIQKLKENPETENTGTKWTEDEINTLLNEIQGNISLIQIASNHKRTVGSIISKLYHIAENYIIDKKMSIIDVSNLVKIPIEKINEHILKQKPKKENKKINNKFNKEQIEETKENKIITLNTEQQRAYDLVTEGTNIFLTGPAGTGKSVTLKEIIKYCKENNINIGVTATTGTAAFLIGGKTIHSYLGIGLAKESAEDMFKHNRYKLKHIVDKLRELSVLIIDEISMLDTKLLEKISDYLCLVRRDPTPFGGLQLILTGDFCQLEPVDGEYCFKSKIWNKLKLQTIYLHKLIRQDNDKDFQKILSKLRYGICSDNTYNKLLELKNTSFGEIKPTKLYSYNVDVDRINKQEYDKLIESGSKMNKYPVKFPQVNSKNKEKLEKWIKNIDLPESVELCVGAQVMITSNIDQDSGLVNGTRGVVVNIMKESVNIKRINGLIQEIKYHRKTDSLDESLYAEFMPLRLAYALTHHKSQGSTLDAIEIDIGSKVFAAGQAYTAISRARDLKSIKITAISKNSFICNKDVYNFYKVIEDEIKEEKEKFVKETLNMVIYNIANHVDLDKTLDFIWEYVSGDDDDTIDYFDNYNDDKLKLDYMDYEVKEEPKEIKTDQDRINKLINMVYKTRKYMLYDIEDVKNKINEFELY